MRMIKVGVLSLQGAVPEHVLAIRNALKMRDQKGEALQIRDNEELADIDCLIIPGGESTTIAKLLKRFDMYAPIRELASAGVPIMGTCAGCILMAKEGDIDVKRTRTELLGLMDMRVSRNSFGRQKESFELFLDIEGLDDPFPAMFIRGPMIEDVWSGCRTLAEIDGTKVMVRQDNLLALSFHPELSRDARVHRMFLDMVTRT